MSQRTRSGCEIGQFSVTGWMKGAKNGALHSARREEKEIPSHGNVL